jgi:hypothetical protein
MLAVRIEQQLPALTFHIGGGCVYVVGEARKVDAASVKAASGLQQNLLVGD